MGHCLLCQGFPRPRGFGDPVEGFTGLSVQSSWLGFNTVEEHRAKTANGKSKWGEVWRKPGASSEAFFFPVESQRTCLIPPTAS